MKNLLALILAAAFSLCSAQADTITLNASGATFPAPLYGRWFAEYNKLHPDVQINYQSVGSGAGHQVVHRGPDRFRRQRRGDVRQGNRGGDGWAASFSCR